MELILELVSLMMVVAMASASPRLNINDDVLVVNVPRFDGELGECREQEVCADVFNFTRDHGDGTGRLESRFIQNCQCPAGTAPCGVTGAQLMFKETRTQSMATCEEATEFPVCGEGDIAKEQHNLGDYVYYKINCVCPNNEEPGDFRSKMTVRKNVHQMTPEQAMIAQKNPRTRYFQCRIFTSQRRRSLF